VIPAKALVVFHDDGHGPWADWFGRDGFRHCVVVVESGDDWIVIDGDTKHGVIFEAVCGADFDLAAYYREMGFTVVATTRRGNPFNPWWPAMLVTCVGVAKKILGIRDRAFLLTPYQLYRYLVEDS